jgi:Amidohydrolase family
VNGTLRTSADFTPQHFEIKGPTLLEIEENTSVIVQGKTANVQDRGNNATTSVPANFFVLSGYVPLTMEMMLVLLKLVGALHRAGVPIVAGTDVGVPGHTLHRELELYVKAGLTPLEAIQAATITSARVMKLENEVGTIEPGKRADLIIVDANPLDNISNIRKVRYVIAQGRLFDSAKLWESVGFKVEDN